MSPGNEIHRNTCRFVLKARTSCCLGICCEVLARLCQHASTSFETKTYRLWSTWQQSCRDCLTLSSLTYFKPVHLTSRNCFLKNQNKCKCRQTVREKHPKPTKHKQMKIGKREEAWGALSHSSLWKSNKHVPMPILLSFSLHKHYMGTLCLQEHNVALGTRLHSVSLH